MNSTDFNIIQILHISHVAPNPTFEGKTAQSNICLKTKIDRLNRPTDIDDDWKFGASSGTNEEFPWV